MFIKNLHIQGYRIYSDLRLEWHPRLNLITGPNGAGKTNLIDAVHYLCMSRSFVTHNDSHVIHHQANAFSIQGHFSGSIRPSIEIQIDYAKGVGKKILVNGVTLDKITDLIGRVPVVVLSPADRYLTHEGPEYRRQFLDSLISQINRTYLQELINYRMILRQRNRLLQVFHERGRVDHDELEPWNQQFIVSAASIIHTRAKVCLQFELHTQSMYQVMAGVKHLPSLTYQSTSEEPSNLRATQDQLERLLAQHLPKDLARKTTTIGPHREDLLFYLDALPLRQFGSQGQHRLFAMALKLSQLQYYEQILEDLPILMLDDVFGDLDKDKTQLLMNRLQEHPGQIFITSANADFLLASLSKDSRSYSLFQVYDGNLTLP
jgi:DNA replication and repair protein RecF